jgi:DNA-binding Lrp family transcriptional regulator
MRGGVGNLYPYIYWYAEGGATGYQSKRWTGSLWDDKLNLEAILNYTYTPWNRSTNAALEFASPESLSLQADSVAQTGFSWKFIDGISNITSIQIETNQSIYLNYDITIWYQKSPTVTTNWIVDTSGNPVVWNSTTTLIYPVFPQATTKYLNLTVESDWDFQGLYNSTYPETNYTHTYRVGDMITCTAMSDETWTLSCSAPNYVTDIALSDSFDSSPITDYVDIQVDMEIDATVEDGGGTPITGGSTNLTVLQSGTGVYKPTNIPASGGIASYLWNIDSTTSGNGTHYIEVFWTNGLEAGYFVTQVFVYYPTTLVADDIVINAYAENTFDIGVDFDDTFLVRGLDGSLASVEYSFDGGANTSLLDQNGGRWTATVSTAGKTNGTYQLVVYAEGLALENQSLTITVNLIYQTQALGVNWSPTNNIPYLNTTKLSITYKIMDGTNITDAIVNVTFQSSTYDMAWDSLSQTYWIDLTGENFTGVPGTFNLNVSAWKKGYEVQVDDTITITIGSQTGEFFEVIYNPDTLNISYIETLFIQVTYEYNSLPINSSTSVNVTFNSGSPVTLTYNPGSTKWEVTLQGRDHFGTWTINVTASASGYTTRWNSTTFIVHEDTPIISSNLPVNVRTDYDHSVTFSVFVTDSIGTAINDANVSFTAFGTFHNYTSGASGEYVITIAPWTTRGPHEFTVIVIRAGYTTSELNFTIIVDASTSFGFEASSYEEYEQWDLTINVEYLDTFYSTPILNAIVNVTIDGNVYPCEFVGYYYQANVTLDLTPGIYTIEAAGSASYANAHTNQVNLDVDAKEVVHIVIEFVPPQVIAGELMEVRATLWSNDSELVMPGFNIHFEISIYYSNGTVIHYTAANQIDTTNSEGVATYSFDVPEGQIDRLSATATYAGQREIWGAQTTKTAGVTVNILSLLFAFLFSDIGLMIILSIALLGIVAAGYNRGVKPKKKLAKLNLENQLQMFNDLETVQHFMAVYLDRGTCVFYHPFTEDRIQPDLISGFIAAITSVYGEIKGDGVRGTLEEIQYHGLRLNSYSGQYIIGILILEGEMTPLLRERLQFFVELFENQYERDLDHWTGLVDCFDPEWVVSTLNAAFNYSWHLPHRFGPTQKVTKTDAKMLDYISAVRDERNEFYIKNLLAPLAEMLEKTEAEVLDRLLLLEERGIIMPIGVQTILQRQGLTLADGAEEQIIRPPESLDESEAVLEFDELEEPQEPTIEEETEIEPPPEPVTEKEVEAPSEPEPEHDSMEAFVQDVESLLISKAKEEDKTEDAELDQFVKELKDKIGEDEESED